MDNLKNILLSEISTVESYLDRLFHALLDMRQMRQLPELKELCARFDFDLGSLFESKLLRDGYVNDRIMMITPSELRERVNSSLKLVTSLILMDFNPKQTRNFTVEYINLLYSYAYELHVFSAKKTNLDVQLPRGHLLDVIPGNEGSAKVSKFSLPLEVIERFTDNKGSISSIDWQRERKYEQLLHQGHEAIYNKKYSVALDCFTKALNYKETAEIINLIGWTHSLMGQTDKAKQYCLKAIEKDPSYGPPYNDLGTYLMAEGQLEEALKWFTLAKKSINYQNREYPYINAGRVYMTQRDFEKALEEFSVALTLAPHHEELHQTVEKIKKSIQSGAYSREPHLKAVRNDESSPTN